MPLLAKVPITQAMATPRLVLTDRTSVSSACRELEEAHLVGAPVIDSQGRFRGSVTLENLRQHGSGSSRTVAGLLDTAAPTVATSATLDMAVDALTTAPQRWVPVLDGDRRVQGTVATSDVVRGYRLGLLASLRQLDGDAQASGTHDVELAATSRLVGRRLRDASLPDDVIITTIQRGRDLVVPNGDTVLQTGDHLVLITRSGGTPTASARPPSRDQIHAAPAPWTGH
jgi:CBS-domain-containing membrane protein